MAKSKKEIETETGQEIEESPVSESQKENTSNNEKTNTKYTLLELVKQSEDKPETYLGLIRNGYREQYLSELKREEHGLNNTPTITLNEFKKIIK